ncbi:MAG: 3-dehydroquinate synthase [Pirellulales bacterium]
MSVKPAQVVRVALGERSYDIDIGAGLLDALGARLTGLRKVTHAVVITDDNVDWPHGERGLASLKQVGLRADMLTVPAGEASKSVDSAAELWSDMLELGTDRRTVVVAIGGGVVGDLAGYVAASFARGLAFVQVPTTLLAQVDSSVGGKVGVNLPKAKNMVGAFWQPLAVTIDTDLLATLPEREYRSGLAEVVKYGVILDAAFFEFLEANTAALLAREPAVLAQAIARSCRLKADVVERDEREETGLRAVLNYGHTFGHAFEAVAGYGELLHGEAISIGMECAARLAAGLGRIPTEFVERQRRLLEALGLPVDPPALDPEALLAAMARDKKVEHGRLRFILPTRLGHVEGVDDVPVDAVRAALGAG